MPAVRMLRDMDIITRVDSIAQAIQLAVAPVFLLTAIGTFLNVIATRLGRVVDRARELEAGMSDYSPNRQRIALDDLAVLARRMTAANWAIALCTGAALLVCLVVGLLFIGELAPIPFTLIALLFIGATALLLAGLLMFFREVQIALSTVRVRAEEMVRQDRA
jgi:hypothetical protein